MKDIAVNPSSNEFLRKNRGFRLTEDDLEYIAQKVRAAISMHLGEWYLDTSLGVPYIPDFGNKAEHRPLMEAMIQKRILAVSGIKRITSFESEVNSSLRTITIKFVAITDHGELKGDKTWSMV